MPSRFSREDLAYDYVLDSDTSSPFGLMFARDKDLTQWAGQHEAAVDSERLRYRETVLTWKNAGFGSGYSRRTPATTGRTAEGALLSGGISDGEWITSKVPDILMPSGKLTEILIQDPATVLAARIHTAREYSGHVYLSTESRNVLRIDNGTAETAVVAVDGGAGYTAYEMEVFAGKLWVTGGTNHMLGYDGTTWYPSDSSIQRRRMAVVYWTLGSQLANGGAANGAGTGAHRLVACDANLRSFYHVADTVDPLVAGNWSSATPVTHAPYYVNSIIGNNRTVWFAANNGVYAVDELGYAPNLTEWMKRHYREENGDQTIYQDGLIWFGHDAGLCVVPISGERQDVSQWAQFGHLRPNQTAIYGRPQVLAPGGDCIWVGYYATQTNTSYIFQLLVDRSDGGLSLRWSGPESVFPGEGLDLVQRISPPDGDPYLLIATRNFSNGTTRLYKQSLPVSGNPYADWRNGTGHRFSERWVVRLPRDDFDATAKKALRRYDLVAANLGGSNTIAIEASADDAAFVSQGTASLSPRTTLVPSEDYVTGVSFNWQLTGTNSTTTPIVLEAFSVRASVLYEPSDVQTFPVLFARGQTLNNGSDETRDPYADWRRLRTFQARGPVRAIDTFGVTKTVKVEPGLPYRVIFDQRRAEWVLVASVTISTLQEPILFDSGDGYDLGGSYTGAAS